MKQHEDNDPKTRLQAELIRVHWFNQKHRVFIVCCGGGGGVNPFEAGGVLFDPVLKVYFRTHKVKGIISIQDVVKDQNSSAKLLDLKVYPLSAKASQEEKMAKIVKFEKETLCKILGFIRAIDDINMVTSSFYCSLWIGATDSKGDFTPSATHSFQNFYSDKDRNWKDELSSTAGEVPAGKVRPAWHLYIFNLNGEADQIYDKKGLPTLRYFSDGTHYERQYLQGKLHQPFDLFLFPFDNQLLEVTFTPDIAGGDLAFDRFNCKFTTDEDWSKLLEGSEWDSSSKLDKKTHVTIKSHEGYERLVVHIPLSRHSTPYFVTVLLPLLLVNLCACCIMAGEKGGDAKTLALQNDKVKEIDTESLAYLATLLLAVFALRQTLRIPNTKRLCVMDLMFLVSYFFISALVLNVVVSEFRDVTWLLSLTIKLVFASLITVWRVKFVFHSHFLKRMEEIEKEEREMRKKGDVETRVQPNGEEKDVSNEYEKRRAAHKVPALLVEHLLAPLAIVLSFTLITNFTWTLCETPCPSHYHPAFLPEGLGWQRSLFCQSVPIRFNDTCSNNGTMSNLSNDSTLVFPCGNDKYICSNGTMSIFTSTPPALFPCGNNNYSRSDGKISIYSIDSTPPDFASRNSSLTSSNDAKSNGFATVLLYCSTSLALALFHALVNLLLVPLEYQRKEEKEKERPPATPTGIIRRFRSLENGKKISRKWLEFAYELLCLSGRLFVAYICITFVMDAMAARLVALDLLFIGLLVCIIAFVVDFWYE